MARRWVTDASPLIILGKIAQIQLLPSLAQVRRSAPHPGTGHLGRPPPSEEGGPSFGLRYRARPGPRGRPSYRDSDPGGHPPAGLSRTAKRKPSSTLKHLSDPILAQEDQSCRMTRQSAAYRQRGRTVKGVPGRRAGPGEQCLRGGGAVGTGAAGGTAGSGAATPACSEDPRPSGGEAPRRLSRGREWALPGGPSAAGPAGRGLPLGRAPRPTRE